MTCESAAGLAALAAALGRKMRIAASLPSQPGSAYGCGGTSTSGTTAGT